MANNQPDTVLRLKPDDPRLHKELCAVEKRAQHENQLSTKYEDLNSKYASLQKKIDEVVEESNDREQALRDLEIDCETIKVKIDEKDKEIKRLQEKNEKLEAGMKKVGKFLNEMIKAEEGELRELRE